ncbi:MAG: PEP-CTERM sorting domain-containing protein, partial [Thiobacillaceae bacterium]
PIIAGPVTGTNGVNSQWVQVNMNWPSYTDPNPGLVSLVRANQALVQFSGSSPTDPAAQNAGLINTYNGVVSQINFANADFNTTVWPVNGNNVVWGNIYGVRPTTPLFSATSAYQDNFAASFNGYIYIPYSGEWNLGVLVDDGFSFTLNGANSQSLSIERDGEAPPNVVSYASNLDLAQGIYSYSMIGYNHLQAGVLSLEWWSSNDPTWKVVAGADLYTSASAVPEPPQLGLMLTALGVIAFVARKRF